jgi:hypothetical protein
MADKGVMMVIAPLFAVFLVTFGASIATELPVRGRRQPITAMPAAVQAEAAAAPPPPVEQSEKDDSSGSAPTWIVLTVILGGGVWLTEFMLSRSKRRR